MPEYRTKTSRSETLFPRATTAIVLTAALAGCAAQGGGQSIRHSEPTFMRLTEERVFAQALRQRYLELATNAYDRADFGRSDFYSLRAIMAVEGKLADPAGAGTGKSDPAIAAARVRLNRNLSRGARIGVPDLAARAQAAYDCWWLESKAGGDPVIANACATNAAAVLAQLDSIGAGIGRAPVPQQYVISGDTPSQVIERDGMRIEIIRQGAPATAPSAPARPVPAEPSFGFDTPQPYVAPLSPVPPQPVQPRRTLPEPVQRVEPVEVPSLRTFTIEPPAPVTDDTYMETVPLPDSLGPVDLIPDYESFLPFAPTQGGQYVAMEDERYAAVGPGTPSVATMPFDAPVYSDADTMPAMAAPVMMDQQGGVLATLLEARNTSGADYSVYFGFDSAEITPEGEDVLVDALERIALEDRGTLSLMGFTDSAGDSRYNQLLAMRRANAVRSFIQSRAKRPVRFEIMPVGEAEAVKNGGDGVTEALNRRVELVLR